MSKEELLNEEEQLRQAINQLTSEQRKRYYQYEQERVKDPDTYAVLNWFFAAGLHHFYLGKFAHGAINFIVMMIGLFFINTWGWVLIVAVFIFELPQLIKSQQIIHSYNNQVMADILTELTQEPELSNGTE